MLQCGPPNRRPALRITLRRCLSPCPFISPERKYGKPSSRAMYVFSLSFKLLRVEFHVTRISTRLIFLWQNLAADLQYYISWYINSMKFRPNPNRNRKPNPELFHRVESRLETRLKDFVTSFFLATVTINAILRPSGQTSISRGLTKLRHKKRQNWQMGTLGSIITMFKNTINVAAKEIPNTDN